jgi:hypothetical protein
VNWDDAGMLEASRDQGFAKKTLFSAVAALEQFFDRDIAPHLFVVGAENPTESAATVFRDDLVPLGIAENERGRNVVGNAVRTSKRAREIKMPAPDGVGRLLTQWRIAVRGQLGRQRRSGCGIGMYWRGRCTDAETRVHALAEDTHMRRVFKDNRRFPVGCVGHRRGAPKAKLGPRQLPVKLAEISRHVA